MPQTSLDFITALDLPKFARIIDIGGGDSKLADHLLQAVFLISTFWIDLKQHYYNPFSFTNIMN